MAKDVRESKGLNIAGAAPVVVSAPTRINSEQEAIDWLRSISVKIDPVYVTQDRNFFTESRIAFKHAEKNNLKIFPLNEWTK